MPLAEISVDPKIADSDFKALRRPSVAVAKKTSKSMSQTLELLASQGVGKFTIMTNGVNDCPFTSSIFLLASLTHLSAFLASLPGDTVETPGLAMLRFITFNVEEAFELLSSGSKRQAVNLLAQVRCKFPIVFSDNFE
jgi:hypothetical protein